MFIGGLAQTIAEIGGAESSMTGIGESLLNYLDDGNSIGGILR